MNSTENIETSVTDNTFKPDKHEVEKLSLEIQELYNGLVSANDKPNVISEEDFVSGFLPYFAGETSIKDNKDFISVWIGIAGAPSNEVAVVDKNYNELYRIPPLMNTSGIEPRTDGAYASLMEEYQNRGAQIPALGDSFLKEEVSHISTEIEASLKRNIEDEKRWVDIFKRYGKKLPQNIKDNTEIILEDEDILDYD